MSNGHNVIAVTFNDDSKAYEALSNLRKADGDGRVGIRTAVIVERRPDGTIRLHEAEDNVIGAGAAGGGLVGMLVGVLGGPVGVLLGLGAGMAIGAAAEVDREGEADDVLIQMSTIDPVRHDRDHCRGGRVRGRGGGRRDGRPRGNRHPAAGR